MKITFFIAYYSFLTTMLPCLANAQTTPASFYSVDHDSIRLDNGTVSRTLYYDQQTQHFLSSNFYLNEGKQNFISHTQNEFYFELNGEVFSGKSKWKFIKALPASDTNQGSGIEVTLKGNEPASNNLTLRITYLLYPNLPVIRKKIAFENNGPDEIKIESLDVENLSVPFDITHTWVMKDYARQKHLGPYLGDWNDAAVVVHDVTGRRGILLGNEAPGVMKRSSVMLDGSTVTIGLTHQTENFPFRKWLKTGGSWESPYAFIILYQHTDDASLVLNTSLSDYVRKYMGIRLASIPYKPTFVYNTWNPFRDQFNENLIDSLVDAAADCGIKEFVLDAGWFGKPEKNLAWTSILGDYDVDSKKFPHGLKPVFDKIKAKGMKPGLWISLGGASQESNILSLHPEWFAQTKSGHLANLHNDYDSSMVTACLTTGWYDYIRDKILSYVKDYGLSYVKLDLSIVTGAYIYNNNLSGCYATNHLHHDREESYIMIYENALKLFDELHKAAPGLFIDCTFETAGKLQLIDYAIVKHAEGDWLSNFEDPQPFVSMRVRDLSWHRSPVMPATALVIGNMQLDDTTYELVIPSLLGALPIVLGDLTKIKSADRKNIKQWAVWMDAMQQKHNYLMYRQDLRGFGAPSEGSWDGFSRINSDTEKPGGIVAVFKQGSKENTRLVTLAGLKTDKIYAIKKAPEGKIVLIKTGRQLIDEGFEVTISQAFGSAVYEVSEKQ